MRPLSANLDQIGPIGVAGDRGVERIERDGRIRVAFHALPKLPDLDRGGDLVARRKTADPARPAVSPIILAVGPAIERHRAEARRVAAAVARLLGLRQNGADVEEWP